MAKVITSHGIKLTPLLMVLRAVQADPIRQSDLMRLMGSRNAAFKYAKFCVQRGLLVKWTEQEEHRRRSFYKITRRGRSVLGWLL